MRVPSLPGRRRTLPASRLYVLREQYLRLRALPYETVYLDGKPLCLLPQQTWNAVALRLQNVLCERPLDQVNLRTDFGQHEGRLSIDTTSVRYLRRFRISTSFTSSEWVGDSLDIKPQDIVRVRFGATRFTE